MNLGRVIGTVVATQKYEGLEGKKFLVVQPLDAQQRTHARHQLGLVDRLGEEVIGASIKLIYTVDVELRQASAVAARLRDRLVQAAAGRTEGGASFSL